MLTAGHTQLPGSRVAYVGSIAYLVGNPTSKRPEAATAHTGGCYLLAWRQFINLC
jgi:hypothetical protein